MSISGYDVDVEDQARRYDPDSLANLPVFPLIHDMRQDIMERVDSALTWDQLSSADINFALIRPLVFKYASHQNMAAVFACLVVKSWFLALSESSLAHEPLNRSRAATCELLAIKLARFFADDQLEMTAMLTTQWSPLNQASFEVKDYVQRSLGGREGEIQTTLSTLEIAIATQSKYFLATPLIQRVITNIYSGKIVFSTPSTHSILADNYKIRAIEFYDVNKSPFLNHYRLRVPRYRFFLDFLRFSILLLTFSLCLAHKDINRWSPWEIIFLIFAASFVFDEYAAFQQYGWKMYIMNLWNVFDISWIVSFLIYVAFRLRGMLWNDPMYSDLAFDVLACGACILFPRLAFFAISQQVIILALRGMISDFFFFTSLAAICFSGLIFTLWALAEHTWSLTSIAWLITQVWFGNRSLSLSESSAFHPIFGPILMMMFSALSGSLLVTILISILTTTYMTISANASQEHLFQFSITTIENIKSDALFSYQPPFNLLAYIILRPLRFFLNSRSFHRVNVALIRVTAFFPLVIIGLYERHLSKTQYPEKSHKGAIRVLHTDVPRRVRTSSLWEAFSGPKSADLLQALFKADEELSDPPNGFIDGLADPRTPTDRLLIDIPSSPTNASRPRIDSIPRSFAFPTPLARSRSRAQQLKEDAQSSGNQPASNVDLQRARVTSFSSPLARLYSQESLYLDDHKSSGSLAPPKPPTVGIPEKYGSVEQLLSDIKGLRLHELGDEMRAIKERQARIESLLITLTKNIPGSS